MNIMEEIFEIRIWV